MIGAKSEATPIAAAIKANGHCSLNRRYESLSNECSSVGKAGIGYENNILSRHNLRFINLQAISMGEILP